MGSKAKEVKCKIIFESRSLTDKIQHVTIYLSVSISVAYPALGRGRSSLSKEIQTLLSPATSNNSPGGHQDVNKPAEKYNLPSMFSARPGVSSWMGMPEKPPQGDIQEAS